MCYFSYFKCSFMSSGLTEDFLILAGGRVVKVSFKVSGATHDVTSDIWKSFNWLRDCLQILFQYNMLCWGQNSVELQRNLLHFSSFLVSDLLQICYRFPCSFPCQFNSKFVCHLLQICFWFAWNSFRNPLQISEVVVCSCFRNYIFLNISQNSEKNTF